VPGDRTRRGPQRAAGPDSSRLRIASAAIVMYSWSRALTSGVASEPSMAARMWISQRSRSNSPIENGKWRARSRGCPRSAEYVVGPPQYWTRNSVRRRWAPAMSSSGYIGARTSSAATPS
jgi:hypothetical protein